MRTDFSTMRDVSFDRVTYVTRDTEYDADHYLVADRGIYFTCTTDDPDVTVRITEDQVRSLARRLPPQEAQP